VNVEQIPLEILYQAMFMSIKIVTLHVAKNKAESSERDKGNLSRDQIWTRRGGRDTIDSTNSVEHFFGCLANNAKRMETNN